MLWTNASFSAAFWGSGVEWYCFDLKSQRTALAGVIGSHNTPREPCNFSNNFGAQHLLRLGSQPRALYGDGDATLDDLREAVTTLEETSRTARRVLGGAHPITGVIERSLEEAGSTLARALA